MAEPKAAEAMTLKERALEFWRNEFCNSSTSNECETLEERVCALAAAFARTLLEEADSLPYESAGAIGKSSDFAAGHLEGWKEMKRRLRRLAGKE